MINPESESAKSQSRRIALNEEQILCNSALESSEFDDISDDEWVALCEKAASKSRPAAAVEGI